MSFESPLPPYNASDPTATFLNSSCLDLLMIELVPMAYRIVNEIDVPSSPPTSPSQSRAEKEKRGSGSVKSNTTGANGARKMDEDEERDAVFYRLEMLGYRVGQGLVERFVDSPPHPSPSLRGGIVGEGKLNGWHDQLLERPPALHGHAGRDQIPVQGPVDASVQKTNR